MARPGSGAAFRPRPPGSPPSLSPRPRVGPGGMAYHPMGPEESPLLQNVLVTRDGVYRPRQGLTTRATYASTIRHVSHRPWKDGTYGNAGNRIMVVEGNALRGVSHTAYTNTAHDLTNWGSSPVYVNCFGGPSGSDIYWIAARTTTNAGDPTPQPGQLFKVDKGGTYAALAGSPPNAHWVESWGPYTVALDRDSIYWSGANNAESWNTGTDVVKARRECGNPVAFVGLSYQQALVLGDEGVALFSGTQTIRQEPLYRQGVDWYGAITRIGSEVFVAGPGNTLWVISPTRLERFDWPIHWGLWSSYANSLRSWFDPVMNWYMLSDLGNSRTYVFDVAMRRWLGLIGQALRGQATIYDNTSPPFRRRFLGLADKLVEWQDGVYTDAGSAFSCIIETAPTVLGGADQEKQLNRVFVDGAGTWSVDLYHRDAVGDPNDGWTTYNLGSVAAPGFVYCDPRIFREFKLRFTATAASGVFFRAADAEAGVRGGPGGGPIRVPLIIPPVAGPGVGHGLGESS